MIKNIYETINPYYINIFNIINIMYILKNYNLIFYIIYILLIKRNYIEAFIIIYNFINKIIF